MSDRTPRPTRYFLDTEFIEDGHTIDLLSIGIVCEDGRDYYAENGEADLGRANPWVKANVLPHLHGNGIPRSEIAQDIVEFVAFPGSIPEFWAYYAAYDWVALCQLYGPMMDLPSGWPMHCMDLKQWAVHLGDPPLPAQESVEHNALHDAWHAHSIYQSLLGARRDS